MKIANIHEEKRNPGVFYAELIDEKGNSLITASLEYILEVIKKRHYHVSNLTFDKLGNFHISLDK